eukprot:4067667-Pyramimonas_sp.AAC.1
MLPASGQEPEPIAVMRKVAHDTFPHMPAMSEHVGIALRGQVANRSAVMAAIRISHQNVQQQLAASGKLADVRRFAHILEGTEWIQ